MNWKEKFDDLTGQLHISQTDVLKIQELKDFIQTEIIEKLIADVEVEGLYVLGKSLRDKWLTN